MKKFLTILCFSALALISFDASAQFAPGTVSKGDTATKGYATKFVMNKLDSQLVYWDKYSYKKVALILADTATIDFAQATATTVTDVTKTIPGARLGDEVAIGVPNAAITATGVWFGWVSAANTVTIRYSPKATENPASGVFHITVFKQQKWK